MTAQDDEPARIRNGRRIHELCAEVARKSAQRRAAKLATINLSSGAYSVLCSIGERDDMTIADVRKALRIESATVSTFVARMQRDGLIEKMPSPHDKRASILKPTPHAREMLSRAHQIMAVEASDITHRFSDAEQSELVRLLERALENLSSHA